jgi:adenylate kinase family enzyme
MPGSPIPLPAIVILPGPPGAGKGPQARMPEKGSGMIQLSAGALLRSAAAAGTPAGLAAKAVMVNRVSGHFTCATCDKGCHDTFKQPAAAGVCDKCGGTGFKRRADDTAETVLARLQACHAQTAPLIAYDDRRGVLERIDAMGPIAKTRRTQATIVARIAA